MATRIRVGVIRQGSEEHSHAKTYDRAARSTAMPRHLTAESLGLDVVLGLALGLGLGNCKFLTRMITMSAGDGGEGSSFQLCPVSLPCELQGLLLPPWQPP